ncbi:hypothetical protein M8J77_015492 [Diaphorina citri]|nr:hypothetical protein M8J77_015492 [Diaphorina citri]
MMASEPLDLTLFLNQEFFYNALDGLNSGVPTRTTPTITPTTLRIFDEMLLQQCDLEGHENEAGFVPPILPPITSSYTQANGSVEVSVVDSAAWQGGSTTVVAPELGANSTTSSLNTSSVEQCSTPPHSTPSSRCDTPPHHPTIQPKRNVGGRRPIKEKGAGGGKVSRCARGEIVYTRAGKVVFARFRIGKGTESVVALTYPPTESDRILS